MDANYIISRIRASRYQYPTVQLLKARLQNMDDELQYNICNDLKKAFYKQSNADIQESLSEFIYRMPMAS